MGSSVIFIDERVADIDSLISGFPEDAEVVRVAVDSDGLDQMVAALQGRAGIEAIHIISHGSSGKVLLGQSAIDQGSISTHAIQLTAIGGALAETGDILLYGCNVAQGEEGIRFIQSLALVTRADVAGSGDVTSGNVIDGNWILEVATGQIDSNVFFGGDYRYSLYLEGGAGNDVLRDDDYMVGQGGNDLFFAGDQGAQENSYFNLYGGSDAPPLPISAGNGADVYIIYDTANNSHFWIEDNSSSTSELDLLDLSAFYTDINDLQVSQFDSEADGSHLVFVGSLAEKYYPYRQVADTITIAHQFREGGIFGDVRLGVELIRYGDVTVNISSYTNADQVRVALEAALWEGGGDSSDTTAPVIVDIDETYYGYNTSFECAASLLNLYFNEPIRFGAGSISLVNVDTNYTYTWSGEDDSWSINADDLMFGQGSYIFYLDYGHSYRIEFGADSIEDLSGNDYAGPSITFTVPAPADTTPPGVTNFSPADEATAVAVDSNIVLTFNETVQRGTSSIVLKTDGGTTIATYNAATSSNLSISGNTLTINPSADLAYNTGYKVEFSSGAIKDLAGNSYLGTTSYNFTTAGDQTAPTITAFSPTVGATEVPVASNIVVTFSENIQRGSGSIWLKTASGDVVETYDVASSGSLSISGLTLTINPTLDLDYETGYTLEFAAGSIEDLARNDYAGSENYHFTSALLPLPTTSDPLLLAAVNLAARAYSDTHYANAGNAVSLVNAEVQGWLPISAQALGFADGDSRLSIVADSLLRYEYLNASATVGLTILEGKRTLGIAFEGTNGILDLLNDVTSIDSHFEKLHSFAAAVADYAQATQIDQVLVTGHSLGGAMAQQFMSEFGNNNSRYVGVTFGSPGTAAYANLDDDFFVNFAHDGDPVPPAGSARGYEVTGQNITVIADASGVLSEHSLFFPDSGQVVSYRNTVQALLEAHPDLDFFKDLYLGTEGPDSIFSPTRTATIYGFGGNDDITGSGTNDVFDGGTGDDSIHGSLGTDTAILPGPIAGYEWSYTFDILADGHGFYTVRDIDPTNGDSGIDRVYGVERLEFDDATASLGYAVFGWLLDGYIAGAAIYVDANGNGLPDPDESTGSHTDGQGHFSVTTSLAGPIIGVGGTNIDTGLPNRLALVAPEGSAVVTPLTTIVADYARQFGVSTSVAETMVQDAFGISADIDLTQYDPFAENDDIATALAVQSAAAQLANLGSNAVAVGVSFDVVVNRIATALAVGQVIDLSSASSVGTLMGTDLPAATIAYVAEINGGLQEAQSFAEIAEFQATGLAPTADGTILIRALHQASGYYRTSGEVRNSLAFAAIRSDGSVVTWGYASFGGDSSSVASQLNGTTDVVQVFSTGSAFAALRTDGSVVTWGDASYGGNSSTVASQLNGTIDVVKVFSNGSAFAALRTDGSVVTWGSADFGGDSSAVASHLNGTTDVVQVFSTSYAFAALRTDGSVVTWGSASNGGDSSAIAGQLNGTTEVVQVFSTSRAFAALLTDGSVVTWGDASYGGSSNAVASQLNGTTDVVQVFSTGSAFAALRTDGSVVTWGADPYGGNSSAVASQLNGTTDVVQVFSTYGAFAALRTDGSVVTWNDASFGGDSSGVASQLNGTTDVVQVLSTYGAFAALRTDGSVVTWGSADFGGNSSAVASHLNGTTDVVQVFSTSYAFAALRTDGSVVTWGSASNGGDSSAIAGQLNGTTDVVQVFSIGGAFAALRTDGSVVTWGNASFGGDSSSVADLLDHVIYVATPFTDDVYVPYRPPVLDTPPPAVFHDSGADDHFNAISGQLTVANAGSEANLSFRVVGYADLGLTVSRLGDYGTLSVTKTTGAWTYTPDNAAIQALKGNATESFTVTVSDGIASASETFTVDLMGANDPTMFGGALTGSVAEDGTRTASGTLSASDRDTGDAAITAQTNSAGSYGSFSIDASGNWIYSLNNAASNVQELKGGQSASDSFNVLTAGGSSQTVAITVTGANDAPVVTRPAADLTIVEDGSSVLLFAGLSITDIDDASLHSVTLLIEGWQAVGDFLSIADAPGMNLFNIDTIDGTLSASFTGPTTIANFVTTLQGISIGSSTDAPAGDRIVHLTVSDGDAESVFPAFTVITQGTNDPATALNTPATSLTLQSGGVLVPYAGVTLVDPDGTATVAGATITLVGASTGDFVAVNAGGTGILSNFAGGTLTLSGTASLETYQDVLGTLALQASNPGARTLELRIDDGNGLGVASTLGVSVESFPPNTDPIGLTFVGDAQSNPLYGGAGNDILLGLAGNDTLLSGDGNDVLDGGRGADQMAGGNGNDLYVVDHRFDQVIESVDTGFDSVSAKVSHTLTDNVENLFLTGSVTLRSGGFFSRKTTTIDLSIDGTGNDGDNLLRGNRGHNELDGLGGNDTLLGGGGSDVLNGGTGADRLVGGAGADSFVFAAGDGGASLAAADMLYDFEDGIDQIALGGGLDFADLTITQGNGIDTAISNTVIGTSSGEYLAIVLNSGISAFSGADFALFGL